MLYKMFIQIQQLFAIFYLLLLNYSHTIVQLFEIGKVIEFYFFFFLKKSLMLTKAAVM